MATITISIKLTDEMQAIALKNFNEMSKRSLNANVDGYPLAYSIEPKAEGESDLQFGERAMKTIIFNTIKANSLRTDRLRHETEKDAIKEISHNIPDKLLT